MSDVAFEMRVDRALGEALVSEKVMSRVDLESQFIAAAARREPLGRVLLESSTEPRLVQLVAKHYGLQYFDLAGCTPTDEAVALIDPAFARSRRALPIEIDAEGRVVAVVSDPFDDDLAETIRDVTGLDTTLAAGGGMDLDEAIRKAMPAVATTRGTTPITVAGLLTELMERKGSDLHLTAGTVPQIRIDGRLVALAHHPVLTPSDLHDLVKPLMTPAHEAKLESARELDFSHPVSGLGRFRVNVFYQRDSIGAVMRAIPAEILTVEQLGLPAVIAGLAAMKQGFVLVTGPTGAGKTTTLAALIDLVNTTRHDHIVTIEDPIEFMHRHKQSIVTQREIGSDTLSFTGALKHALRQDPDVILVGEMRDLETIAAAITAAETGHLVFATLHTRNASQSIERMIDVFPAHQQAQVRVQLAGSLSAIISQQLIGRADGRGRVPAVEVLVATSAIRNLIREGKDHQIMTAIQSGGQHGMQTMDAALALLTRSGAITREAALEHAHDTDVLMAHL